MKKVIFNLAALFAATMVVSVGCGDDESPGPGDASTGGSSGSGSGGKSSGGTANTGGHVASGGASGSSSGGSIASGATTGSGASTGSGGIDASAGGSGGSVGDGGPDGSADGGDADRVARGAYLVRSAALCAGCHTASGGAELGGNPAFGKGLLPAPNLTPDPATGLGTWTDRQIVNAIRDGVDAEGRHLNSAMPYWLFHNMSDADALSIVAFLRSLPPVSALAGDAALGSQNPDATPVTPLTGLPDSSLQPGHADYEAAQAGKYLATSVAQCVRCHSPASGGLPTRFFSGNAPTSSTQIFASNLTPDPTGLGAGDAGPAWTAADIATALKLGKDKDGVALCGSMPSGARGYGGLTDADANAIGVYLTTIAPVAHPEASPSLEPPCP